MNRGKLSIISCDSGKNFALRVADRLKDIIENYIKQHDLDVADDESVRLDELYLTKEEKERLRKIWVESEEVWFANKEVKTVLKQNIRGDDVYIIQCMDDPLCSERSINDNFMALITAVNAAYQSDAEHVTVVLPQFPYSRQDRRKGREGITAKQIASFIEASGAKRVITLDIHSESIQGYFNTTKLENLRASRVLLEHLPTILSTDNLVVVSPDAGGTDQARFYSRKLKTEFAIVDKARDYSRPSTIESMRLIGNVQDKNVLIVDDMIATGGTLVNATNLLKNYGAHDIYIACSLPFFNGTAVEKLDDLYKRKMIKKVIGTDAVFRGEEFIKNNEWYEEASVASLFANVIFHINMKKSVSALLK